MSDLTNNAPNDAAPVSHEAGDSTILLARRPILTLDSETHAHEVASPDLDHAQADALPDAVRRTVHAAVNVIGLGTLVGDKRLIIPMTVRNLAEDDHAVLVPDRTTLQIIGQCSPADIDVLANVRRSGYTLATVITVDQSIDATLIDACAMARVRLCDADHDSIRSSLEQARSNGSILVADGVDTLHDLKEARSRGFDLACGRYFCEPQEVSGSEVDGLRSVRLQLLAELNKPEINFRAVEETIKCDATLSCNLLRYMNSAAMGIREPITSIAQALRMLGERPLRKWGSLVTMASLNECGAEEILTTSLVRARFCEEMAPIAGEQEHELDYFLVGIFSLIDAITGQPMRQTILGLPLQDRVRQTLLGERDSNLGRALQIIEACERGGWATVDAACTALQVSQQEIAIRYYDALHWAHQTLTSGDHAA